MAISQDDNDLSDNPSATLYEQIGGRKTCQRLSKIFHDRIAHDPLLKEIFPKNLVPATERLALFLTERLGGPKDYTAQRGKQSLRCRHAHVPIGSLEAERWLEHMSAAMKEIGLTGSVYSPLCNFFQETATTLTDPFLPLYHLPLDELRSALEQNPDLVMPSEMGHTLLSNAASHWDLPRVLLLLEYNADVHQKDRLGHNALYQAVRVLAPAPESEGCAVVETLLRHGAMVNEQSGPGQSAALHMAARRGHVAIAKVLLDAGADIEMKDSKGETPLRRAVNCGQQEVVFLLLSRGADPLTKDKQGHAPLDVARQKQIRDALQEAVNS